MARINFKKNYNVYHLVNRLTIFVSLKKKQCKIQICLLKDLKIGLKLTFYEVMFHLVCNTPILWLSRNKQSNKPILLHTL